MPLLKDQRLDDFAGAEGPIARLPDIPKEEMPSFLDVATAAERTSNVAGALYDQLANPPPKAPIVPGFDPLVSVPEGYEDRAKEFLSARSPQEMEHIRQRLDIERADQDVIRRAGGWGTAATFAAGLTDPLTIASMAIPGGGETRLATAARLALINAGTSGAQELAMHQLRHDRTEEESFLNIGASALMGGILGSVLHHIPRAKASELRESLEEGAEIGPSPRTIMTPERGIPEGTTIDGEPIGSETTRYYHGATSSEAPTGSWFTSHLQDAIGWAGEHGEVRYVDLPKESGLRGYGNLEEGIPYPSRIQLPSEIAEKARPLEVERLTNNASGESAASAEAISRVEQEKAAGQTRALIDKDGTVRPLTGVDAVDATAREGQVIVQRGVGEDEWSILDRGGLSKNRASAAMKAAVDQLNELHEPAQMIVEEHYPEAIELADTGLPYVNPTEESTVGSAQIGKTTREQETIAAGAETAAKTVGRLAPGLRLLTSPSIAARRLVQGLVNTAEVLNKNMQGVASQIPIERKLWRYEGKWQVARDQRSQSFKEYRERIAGEGGQPLSRKDFDTQISYALRRSDRSPIKEVADAAKKTRATIFQPLYERAKAAGLLPEEAKLYADSYLMRQYDMRKIRANQSDWIGRISSYLIGQGVDRPEAADIAHAATRNVLGSERGTMDWRMLTDQNGQPLVAQSGRLKERTLAIPDVVLEPYLNNDIDHLTHSYLRSLAPEVEMHEAFGSRDLKDQIAEITDEYTRMKERARVKGDNEEMTKLDARRDADIRDISAVRDRLYGVYGQPKDPASFFVRAGRMLRSDNALRLLGAATLAHIPDFANIITRYGLTNTMSGIAKIMTSSEAMSLTRSEAHRFGAALDMAMNTVSLLGDFGSHSQFAEQRVMNKLTRAFTIVTGETPLITAVQMVASTLGQHELLTTAAKVAAGEAIDKNLAIRLASAGLDDQMLKRISTMDIANGREINGLKFGMSDIWSDKKAAEAFETAILKDAHGMTLRPSSGDTPLFMSTELGKSILQFKTFAFAAQRSVVNPIFQGLVRGDPRSAVGLISLLAAGTASYVAKQTAAGQPMEFGNPGRLAMEIADKSNMMGWTADAVFPLLWQMGFKDLSRWSDRDPVETLLGPSAGTVASAFERGLPGKVLHEVTGEAQEIPSSGITRSDEHFLRRLAPGQNLWYTRKAVNDLEDSVGDLFDLPGKSNAERMANLPSL